MNETYFPSRVITQVFISRTKEVNLVLANSKAAVHNEQHWKNNNFFLVILLQEIDECYPKGKIVTEWCADDQISADEEMCSLKT